MTAPEHAHKPSEQANEHAASSAATGSNLANLRDRILAITARLGRELATLRALHQQIGDQP